MSSPSNSIVPSLAGSVPASTAMNVDLPAPLGPIRPVILPRSTTSDTPSTACTPSKWRRTSRATSIGRSGSAGTFNLRPGEVLRVQVPRLRPHALGAEPQEPEDEEADEDPLERGDQVRRPDVEPAEQARHLLETDGHEQRAQDRADIVAAAADDDGGEQDDRLRVKPRRRRPHAEEADEDCPREPGDRSADDEDRHLEGDRVLAQRRGRELVLAHRAQRAAEWRVHDPLADEPHETDAHRRE